MSGVWGASKMGVVESIDCRRFPRQGDMLHRRVLVCFKYDTTSLIGGTVVREDVDEPYRTITRLDDGKFILWTEFQYREED